MIPNKVQNLIKLGCSNNEIFEVPKFIYFKVENWMEDKIFIINSIQKNFTKKIAVRSAALTEDNNKYSNAGKYLSILNVNTQIKKEIINAINRVIKSYEKKNIKSNFIIIQTYISSISISGVVFSQDLLSGGPYFAINYDDQTGRTDTITSGKSTHSNKVLYVRKSNTLSLKSERFKKIIKATTLINSILNLKYTDIEFCMDKQMNIYIFQARRLNIKRRINSESFNKIISINKKKLKNFFENYYKVNKDTILGKMPDWNPVEIIGSNPKNLAYDLYEKLITNKNWYEARKIMGYSKLENSKLMYQFCGSPFIDTHKSFLSLTPNSLKKQTKEKLVDFYINKLKNNHDLHDKVEFEIIISSFDFNIQKKIQNLVNFSKEEKNEIHSSLKKLFIKNLHKNSKGSIENSLTKIQKLALLQLNFKKNKKLTNKLINKTINDCIQLGVIPFAILARHAFIATNILNSLVEGGYLSNKRILNFKESINTVLTKYLDDLNYLSQKKLTKKNFMEMYGHLRPGTYDIESKRYDEFNYIDTNYKKIKKKDIKFKFTKSENQKIQNLLNKNNIRYIGPDELFFYIKRSIEGREYSKFIFTKSVSHLLEEINKNLKTFKKSEIAFLNLRDIKSILKQESVDEVIYKKKIIARKKKHLDSLNIKTPELIIDKSYIDVVPYQTNKPNFITDKRVSGSTLTMKNNQNLNKINFKNKIVFIENADPGYDWLFTKNILALVTKYGGRNSHMAIRCYELNVPAVIGCGEKIFENLLSYNKIYIDGNNEIIKEIN